MMAKVTQRTENGPSRGLPTAQMMTVSAIDGGPMPVMWSVAIGASAIKRIAAPVSDEDVIRHWPALFAIPGGYELLERHETTR